MPASPPTPDPGTPRRARADAAREAQRPARARAVQDLVATAGLAAAVIVAIVAGLVLFDPGRKPPPPAPSGVRGIAPGEIALGMVSPFSGANRELGRDMKAGVETAFAEVNAAGGLHGRKLRLVAVDDGYEPSRTRPAMKQLIEGEKVFAVVGNVGTPTAAVAIPYSTERKAIFFGALSGSEILRKDPPDRYVFNFRPSYAEETAAAVRYLADVRRIPPGRIAVFAQEDAFGESGWTGASRQLTDRGVRLPRIVRVGYRRNTADVDGAVKTIARRAKDLDAVVMIATYKAAATFIRKLRDRGLGLLTTNVSPVDSNALAEELIAAGPRYADGVVVTQVVPLPGASAPGMIRFREALARHAPGERAGFLTLEGWIVGHVFAEGLRRAGPDPDADKVVEALEGIRDLDLGIGTLVSFGPQEHQGSHKVWGTILERDGTWKQIDLQ